MLVLIGTLISNITNVHIHIKHVMSIDHTDNVYTTSSLFKQYNQVMPPFYLLCITMTNYQTVYVVSSDCSG